jgi:hypothetical protein
MKLRHTKYVWSQTKHETIGAKKFGFSVDQNYSCE